MDLKVILSKMISIEPGIEGELVHEAHSYSVNTQNPAATLPKLVSTFSLNSPNASDPGQQIDYEQPKRLSGLRTVFLQGLRTKPKGESMW